MKKSSLDSTRATTETTLSDKSVIASNNLNWTELKPTNTEYAPSSRSCHTSVLYQEYMIIFGGKEGDVTRKYVNDINILNLETVSWENVKIMPGPQPGARLGHTACLYDENKIVVFGGWDGSKVLNDTWILHIQPTKPIQVEWQQMALDNPAPKRQFHTSNIYENIMYVFGGGDGKCWVNELSTLNLKAFSWNTCETTGNKPAGRLQHCSILDNGKLYIFGGEPTKQQQLNDLYVLDLYTFKWDKISVLGAYPIPRVSSSAQKRGNRIFFFGGFDGQTWLQDVFAYNSDHKNWEIMITTGQKPRPRCRHTMVTYDNKLVVFGGNDFEMIFSDIYTLDLEVKFDSNSSTLADDYKTMMQDKLFCDVVFQIEEEEFPAHKAVLAARCEHFKTMFLSNHIESQASKIRITDIKPIVFKAMLEYIYCDQILLNDELAIDLMVAANKFLLHRLKTLCEQFLSQRLSVSNVIDIINQAELHGAELLKEYGLVFMLNNREAIIETQDVLKASKEVLAELYKRRTIN